MESDPPPPAIWYHVHCLLLYMRQHMVITVPCSTVFTAGALMWYMPTGILYIGPMGLLLEPSLKQTTGVFR